MPSFWPCYSSTSKNCHLIIINPHLVHCLSARNYHSVFVNVTLNSQEVSFGSLYCPPSADLEVDAGQWLSSRGLAKSQIIMGDFNSPNVLWGYTRNEFRGVLLEDLALAHELIFLNNPGCIATFVVKHGEGR